MNPIGNMETPLDGVASGCCCKINLVALTKVIEARKTQVYNLRQF